jgi:hypothetical protein
LVSTVSGVRIDSGILVLKPGVASSATVVPVISAQFTSVANSTASKRLGLIRLSYEIEVRTRPSGAICG